jgi:hypothetical protein
MFRPSHVLVALSTLAAAACDSSGLNGNFVHVINFALVRFVNDTDTPISVLNNGVLDPKNSALVFGNQSACFAVDLTNSANLTFTNSTTGAVINVFTSTLPIGGNLTIVAFQSGDGAIVFSVLNNTFTPATGKSGLRFFNGAAGVGALTMKSNNAVVSGPTALGIASPFVSVLAVSQTITFVRDTTTVLNAGSMTFIAGQNTAIIVGPPSVGTTTPRFFTTSGC